MQRKTRLPALMMLLAVAACTGASPSVSTDDGSIPGTEPGVDSLRIELVDPGQDVRNAPVDVLPPGSETETPLLGQLTLLECFSPYPGATTFRVGWSPEPGDPERIVLRLRLTDHDIGTGLLLALHLDGAGDFAATVTHAQALLSDRTHDTRRNTIEYHDAGQEPWRRPHTSCGVNDEFEPIEVRPQPIRGTAPAGSLQEYAQRLDPTEAEHSLALLTRLHGEALLLPMDRLFVIPGGPRLLGIRRLGDDICPRVVSFYEGDLMVSQTEQCLPFGETSTEVAGVASRTWTEGSVHLGIAGPSELVDRVVDDGLLRLSNEVVIETGPPGSERGARVNPQRNPDTECPPSTSNWTTVICFVSGREHRLETIVNANGVTRVRLGEMITRAPDADAAATVVLAEPGIAAVHTPEPATVVAVTSAATLAVADSVDGWALVVSSIRDSYFPALFVTGSDGVPQRITY